MLQENRPRSVSMTYLQCCMASRRLRRVANLLSIPCWRGEATIVHAYSHVRYPELQLCGTRFKSRVIWGGVDSRSPKKRSMSADSQKIAEQVAQKVVSRTGRFEYGDQRSGNSMFPQRFEVPCPSGISNLASFGTSPSLLGRVRLRFDMGQKSRRSPEFRRLLKRVRQFDQGRLTPSPSKKGKPYRQAKTNPRRHIDVGKTRHSRKFGASSA